MKRLTGFAALAMAAVAVNAGQGLAQTSAQTLPEVVVTAPVSPKEIVRPVTGPYKFSEVIEEVKLIYRVAYKDLDLTSEAGKSALHARVNEAAQLVCQDVNQIYRRTDPANLACVKDAKASAQEQMDYVIATAKK